MENDKRIGTWATDEHRTIWPELTLSGRRLNRWPASSYRNISLTQFVVIDSPIIPGFDYDAAYAELVKPKKASKMKVSADEQTDE